MNLQCWFSFNKIDFIENCHFQYRGQFQNSILYQPTHQIIENPVSKMLSLFAEFSKVIPTKMAPKSYIESPI